MLLMLTQTPSPWLTTFLRLLEQMLLMLTQKLRGLSSDDQLLLNAMKENCKTSPKDWTALADEIMEHKQR